MAEKTPVLLSVAGTTVPVITETLYGLYERDVRSGRIVILTTTPGKTAMQRLLPSGDGLVDAFNAAYKTQWTLAAEDVRVITHTVANEWGTETEDLEDLRTTEHNESAANQIVAHVKALTRQDNVIVYASLAGGRKTMGIYLYQAMSFFARPADELSHVLVSETRERDRAFFFPDPDDAKARDDISYATIPFIKLRPLVEEFLQRDESYTEMVARTETLLADQSGRHGPIIVHSGTKGTGYIRPAGGERIDLRPLSLALYVFLLEVANLERDQTPFLFDDAFKHRESLARCIAQFSDPEDAIESVDSVGTGLAQLRAYCDIGVWPDAWQDEADATSRETRRKELNSAFGRLQGQLRGVPKTASYAVGFTTNASHGGPGRFVIVDPGRIQYSPSGRKSILE